MALDQNTQTALAQEVRRQQAALALESIKGQMKGLADAAQVISSLSQDAGKAYQTAAQTLAALQIGAGPGLTSEFGQYSEVDQLLRKERFAGKQACLDYVHTHPEATEAEATEAWTAAALAATGMEGLFQDASRLGALYRSQLKAAGAIPDTTWESQRAWILARTTEEAMGL